MYTQSDVRFLLEYFSDNYIICQYKNGESVFTELLLKDDVFEGEHDIKEVLK